MDGSLGAEERFNLEAKEHAEGKPGDRLGKASEWDGLPES
jgi:hypothetical protein